MPAPTPSTTHAQAPPPTPAELLRWGLIMAVTMTLHNLPEGVAVAAAAGTGAGGHVAAAVAAHNIPEGIVIAAPVYAATGSRWAALAIAAASGLSEPVGAAGALLAARAWDAVGWGDGGDGGCGGSSGGGLLPLLLAGAGGVMAAVCVLDLIPEASRCGARGRMVGGVVVGAGVMAATLAAGV
jgi:ZIP family zinc transporter